MMRRTLELVTALGPRTTADLTTALIARFVAGLGPELSSWTVKAHLSRVRTLCGLAEGARRLDISPFRLRKLSRWIRTTPPQGRRHYSREDIRTVLDSMRRDCEVKRGWPQWRCRRLYCLTALVAYTGLRRDEALRLELADLDLVGRVIRLVPRGRTLKTAAAAQPVPMPEALVPILAAWLEHRLDCPADYSIPPADRIPWLFPGARRRGPWVGGNPQTRAAGVLRAAASRAGVEGMTFQSLRRSWAVHAEAWGLGGALIQRVLRHTSSRTTELWYRAADAANLADAVRSIEF
jgi:integrase